MLLSSCSLFRLVQHPVMLPSPNNMEKATERQNAIEAARYTALLEIRVSLREGDDKFARAGELLGKGHCEDAATTLQLAQLCYEYADGIEREANVFFEMQSNLALFDEALHDQVAKESQIQQLHSDIDTTFKDSMRGVWPLHTAAANGAIGTISYLLNKFGERVDAVDRAGKTALHVAVENGHLETARALIEQFGANPARRTFTGRTPIHIASDIGDDDMVRGLFEGCASIITKDVDNGVRPRVSQDQIADEALTLLGCWKETDHGNSALALAVNKLHSVSPHHPALAPLRPVCCAAHKYIH